MAVTARGVFTWYPGMLSWKEPLPSLPPAQATHDGEIFVFYVGILFKAHFDSPSSCSNISLDLILQAGTSGVLPLANPPVQLHSI